MRLALVSRRGSLSVVGRTLMVERSLELKLGTLRGRRALRGGTKQAGAGTGDQGA